MIRGIGKAIGFIFLKNFKKRGSDHVIRTTSDRREPRFCVKQNRGSVYVWGNNENNVGNPNPHYLYSDYHRTNADNNTADNDTEYYRPVDKNIEQAQALFADFGTTYAELKKRYRKLAMQYHPDHGGDNELFAAIVAEYEYLKKTRFPEQK